MSVQAVARLIYNSHEHKIFCRAIVGFLNHLDGGRTQEFPAWLQQLCEHWISIWGRHEPYGHASLAPVFSLRAAPCENTTQHMALITLRRNHPPARECVSNENQMWQIQMTEGKHQPGWTVISLAVLQTHSWDFTEERSDFSTFIFLMLISMYSSIR